MKDIPEMNRMESTGLVKVAVFFRTVTSHHQVNGRVDMGYGVYLISENVLGGGQKLQSHYENHVPT